MGELTFNIDMEDLENLDYNRDKKSIDIVICLDTSGSMEATDYLPNRFEVAKNAAQKFLTRKILENYDDRVALITFGGNTKVHFKLTSELDKVGKILGNLGKHSITHTSTSYFNVIKASVDVLKAQKNTTSKAIILLTDGDDWGGKDPLSALGNNSIPIYTIGIGAAKSSNKNRDKFDEGLLKKIAKLSGGKYYYAPDMKDLIGIFENLADL